MDFTLGIILNRDLVATLLMSWYLGYQVIHKLIVYLEVANSNSELLFEPRSYLLEYLCDGSWYDSSVLVVLCASTHCERLSSSCLSIDHDCPVEPFNHGLNYITGTLVENFLL
jgi:hypothetical protein